jgi:hypothetical protein
VHRQGRLNASRRQKPIQPTGTERAGHRTRIPDFLAEGYEFKTIADYGIGPAIDAVSPNDAASAIDAAGRFIDAVTDLLAGEARAPE